MAREISRSVRLFRDPSCAFGERRLVADLQRRFLWRIRNSRQAGRRLDILLLPSSVGGRADSCSNRFLAQGWKRVAGSPYRGGRRQDDVPDGGLELVDGGLVLVRAVVRPDGLDFHMELPGLFFVLGVAGRIEGILFGM